jgi:hypothetical protein
MGDLEPVGAIIPRVYDQIARSADEAARADINARWQAISNLAKPQVDPEIQVGEWLPEPLLRRWPTDLVARLYTALDAIRTLQLDTAIDDIFELIGELTAIDHAAEQRRG